MPHWQIINLLFSLFYLNLFCVVFFFGDFSRFCVCSLFLLYQQPLKRGFWFLQKVKLNFDDQLTIPDLFYSSSKNWPWCSFRFDPPDQSPPTPHPPRVLNRGRGPPPNIFVGGVDWPWCNC